MVDLNASLCDLPVELKVLVLSHIEHIKAHHILALSSTFHEAFSLLRALPRTFDFEGVEGDLAFHLVRVLDDDRVRSLEKERALELIGEGNKDRLCEYACVQRNFKVLRWAHNELDLPWAQYPAEPVSDDVLVLRMLREAWPKLQERWPEAARPEDWEGVTMEDGRVVKLELNRLWIFLTGAVPAEIGQLTSLKRLDLSGNRLTSLPAEIGQFTSLTMLSLRSNHRLTSVPAEIGRLTSLTELHLSYNQLTSLPPEIGQLTSLTRLNLDGNQLTSVPAEIWQLPSLEYLALRNNQLKSLPAEIWRLTSLRELDLGANQLTSVPAEIGQLASLVKLSLDYNQLTSLPAEIEQLTALTELHLERNQLWPDGIRGSWSPPAVIRKLIAAGCDVHSVDVRTDEDSDDGMG